MRKRKVIRLIEFVFDNPISEQLFSSLLVIVILSIIFIIIGKKVEKLSPTETPKGFVFLMVQIVDLFNNFIKQNLSGKRFEVFGAYLFSIIIFLAVGNTISLIGLAPPFSNLGMAMTLSIITFFVLQFAEFKFQGVKGKVNNLLGAWKPLFILLLPMNIISEFSKPLTMGLRLFVNLFSGMIISIMIYTATNFIFGALFGVGLHAIFDIFFGLIQAFVFFMLSLVNISMAADSGND